MSAADGPGRPPPGGAQGAPGPGPQSPSTLAALVALAAALGQLFAALRKLAAAEARMLQAGIPLFFMAATALVAFSVSLWVCLVALIGWALMRGTHSLGLALGLLVVLHAILVIGVWSVIKYSIHQATFPQARRELHRLGRTMLHDLNRFTGAAPGPVPASRAAEPPDKKETA